MAERAALAALLAVAIAAANPAPAQEDDAATRLSAVRLEMEAAESEARRLADEASALGETERRLARELVALAAEERRREESVVAAEARLAALRAEETAKSGQLASRRAELATTLAVLLQLARRPPEALIAMPVSLGDIYATGRLIGGLVPALEARAAEIALDLERLSDLRAQVTRERSVLEDSRTALAAQRAEVAAVIEETARLRALTAQDQAATIAQVAALAAEAADLEELIREAQALIQSDAEATVDAVAAEGAGEPAIALASAIEPSEPEPEGSGVAVIYGPPLPTAKPEAGDLAAIAPAAGEPEPAAEAEIQVASIVEEPVPPPSFSAAKGILPLPVAGRIVSRFGDRRGDGTAIKGLVVEALAEAQVVAPFDGEVVFAGPFKEFGQLLIIAHGEGYHSVLAGFATIHVTTGQAVLAGEPVGRLGDSGSRKSNLYIELRHDGQPIDPMPWISRHDDKDEG